MADLVKCNHCAWLDDQDWCQSAVVHMPHPGRWRRCDDYRPRPLAAAEAREVLRRAGLLHLVGVLADVPEGVVLRLVPDVPADLRARVYRAAGIARPLRALTGPSRRRAHPSRPKAPPRRPGASACA